MKEILISVDDEVHSGDLERYILQDLNFEVQGVGCGSAEYIGNAKNVKVILNKLRKEFGNRTVKNIVVVDEEEYK